MTRAKVELVGDAVEQWQTEQHEGTTLENEVRYPQMKELAKVISQRRQTKGVADAVQQLTELLQPQTQNPLQGMDQLADAIRQRQNVRALLSEAAAPLIEELTQKFQLATPEQPEVKLQGIPELAEAIRSRQRAEGIDGSGD